MQADIPGTELLIAAGSVAAVMFIIVQSRARPRLDDALPILRQPRILFAIGGIIGTSMIMMWAEVWMARFVFLPITHALIVNQARAAGVERRRDNN